MNYWLKDELPAEFGQPVHKDISPRPPTEPQELYGGTTAVFDDEYKSTFMMESCRINEDDEELHVHRNLRQSKGLSRRNQLLRSPDKLGGSFVASAISKNFKDQDAQSNQAINAESRKQEDTAPLFEVLGSGAELAKTEERPSTAI